MSKGFTLDKTKRGNVMQHELYLLEKKLRAVSKPNAFSDAFITAVQRKEAKRKDMERKEARQVKRFVPVEN